MTYGFAISARGRSNLTHAFPQLAEARSQGRCLVDRECLVVLVQNCQSSLLRGGQGWGRPHSAGQRQVGDGNARMAAP